MTPAADPHSRVAGLTSLVMPAWNPNPAWLRQAVASALDQRGCEIELIVVDDGSQPPIEDHLEEFDDDRLRLLRIPHGRVSRARNAALEVARGEFVRFIDADDVILPESTAHLLSLVGRDAVVAYGATLVCDEELRPVGMVSSTVQGNAAERCLLNAFATTIHSLLFPRVLVDEVGPWEPSIVVSQDWDFALRAFELAPVRGDRQVVTHYRMHPRMNSRDVEEGIRGYRLVVERYFERHPERRGSRLHRRALAAYHVFAAVQLAIVLRRYVAAARHLRRALVLDPVSALVALPRQGWAPLAPVARQLHRVVPVRWRRRA